MAGPSAHASATRLRSTHIVTANDQTETTTRAPQEFGRGYYAFFGAVAGFFVTATVALTVIIGYATFQGDPADASSTPPSDTTVASDETVAGDPAAGEAIFASTCSVCHGAVAEGVPGLGPPLVNNVFIAGLSDEELLAFINEGRPTDHPDNTTGVAMPPKGGNASLTDDDIIDVIAYLRSLG